MKNNTFKDSKFLLQIILDGYGIGKKDHTNAIYKARTPYMDFLLENYANTQLSAHGAFVGLAGEKDLGGSEVGHTTIGAGKIIPQLPNRIQKMIQDGSFAKSPCLQKVFKISQKGALHLIGLLSDGNIHSHLDHLIAIIKIAAKNKVTKCYLHALLDGRDTAIQSALKYTERIEKIFSDIMQKNQGFHYSFASAGGREYTTMDRAKNWFLIERGWRAHVLGKADFSFSCVQEGIEYFRSKDPKIIDQDIPVFTIHSKNKNSVRVKDEDAVFFFNFRADRALEFSSIWYEENFQYFSLQQKPKAFFAAMTVYDQKKDQPKNRVIEGLTKSKFLGDILLEKEIRQFRLSETQKYPHVTFFYNGGRAFELDKNLETYCIIESNPPHTFATTPEMKALEITQQAINFIKSQKYQFGVINFPNPDMIGHTGNFSATLQAVEVIDKCLQKICEIVIQNNGIAIIIADHGNADEMLEIIDGKEQISTKHSLNPVPFIILDKNFQKQYQLKQRSQHSLGLSQIAATSIRLLGLKPRTDFDPDLFEYSSSA